MTVLEELIDGITVSDALAGGRYNESGTRNVVKSLCDALFAHHSLGIVHRETKPENVMCDDGGDW